MSDFQPTPDEQAFRDDLARRLLTAIQGGETIYLPAFDRERSVASDEQALVTVGVEPNPWGGTVAAFRYQLEGEEDLLHLFVVRQDGSALTPEQAQLVAGFVWAGVPAALIWLKPGRLTQHFYVGHDDLVGSLRA